MILLFNGLKKNMKLHPYKKYFIGLVTVSGVLALLFWSWGEYALMFVVIGFLMGIGFMLWLGRKALHINSGLHINSKYCT